MDDYFIPNLVLLDDGHYQISKYGRICQTYSYSAKADPVLIDVNASFVPGTLYAIVGRSGWGKTTLLSLLAVLDKPGEGQILLDGKSSAEWDAREYRTELVSQMYQDYNLLPFLTSVENIALCLQLKGRSVKESRATAKEKLRQVGLDETYDKRFLSMMSGG